MVSTTRGNKATKRFTPPSRSITKYGKILKNVLVWKYGKNWNLIAFLIFEKQPAFVLSSSSGIALRANTKVILSKLILKIHKLKNCY